MAAHEPFIPTRLLSSDAFRRDLESFLNLDASVILAISTLANSPDGFVGSTQAARLQEETNLPIELASSHLSMAAYLYDQVTNQELEVSVALDNLEKTAMDLAISQDESRRPALAELLSYKREYEIVRDARDRVTGDIPHYLEIAGSWNIRIHQTREDEIVKVPLLGFSLIWHDANSVRHQEFCFLTNDNWEEFKETVALITNEREHIQEILGN